MPESEANDEFNDDVRLVLLFPILPGPWDCLPGYFHLVFGLAEYFAGFHC